MKLSLVTYNVLEQSLASAAIPWVMAVPAALLAQATDFEKTKRALTSEYVTHWHKSERVGPNYIDFRALWGYTAPLARANDVPWTFVGARWVELDTMEYETPTGCTERCLTMRGVLRRSVRAVDGGHEALAERILEYVRVAEREVFAWPVRGPRLLDVAANRRSDAAAANRALYFGGAGLEPGEKPDLVVLCEYDLAQQPPLDFFGDGASRTFPEAMQALGYHSVLLESIKRDGKGVAVFAKAIAFSLSGAAAQAEPMQMTVPAVSSLDEGELRGLRGRALPAAVCVDLRERWHPLKRGAETIAVQEEMRFVDRRVAGVVALERRCHDGSSSSSKPASSRRLLVVAAHLMTSSRDGSKTNLFPGEVRAGELCSIRAMVERCAEPGDSVLLAGDFNVDARKELSILCGQLGALELDTGYARETGSFTWAASQLVLKDAFRDVNRQTNDADGRVRGTSHNANRVDTIDYVFHSRDLIPEHKSPLVVPMPNAMPDLDNPSDHIPLVVSFQWADD